MKKTKMVSSLTALICVILMSGCASIVSKSKYPVTITSEPSRAKVVIKDNTTGQICFEGQTPTIVTLSTSAGYFRGKSYTATFTKPGYTDRIVDINRGFDGWYIGNVVFGLLGGPIGFLVVDPMTGAMWTLPQDVTATLTEDMAISQKSEDVNILSLDQVPSDMLDQMVQVN